MDGGLREWLEGLSRRELTVLVVVGALLLGGVGLWYARARPEPVAVEAPREGKAGGPSPTPVSLFVHVAGWVRRPGVYELAEGARVIDAIELAGGPKKGAALDALNLAAVLTDGQQVLVPKTARGGPAAGGVVGGAEGSSGKVNLNSADAAALEELPGIGEVLASRIIEYREEHGPFASVDDLIGVSGIGEVTLEELRDLVTV